MSYDPKEQLLLLTGCTAVGKTDLALRCAEALGAEIVSADSLLFYRGMDIGTAKPSPEERARVRHHLIDVSPVADQWDVARYVEVAGSVVRDIFSRGRRVLVTGGSGFYLKSFWAPVVDAVAIPVEVSEEVTRLEKEGVEAMKAKLIELNPEGTGEVDLCNPRRVRRALERCLASGKTVARLQKEFQEMPPAFGRLDLQAVVLERDPAELRERIASRVRRMLEAGLIEEVRALRAAGIEKNPSAAHAIGYRETLQYLNGELPREKLQDEIERNTNRLARKQRTWFRTQLPAGCRAFPLSGDAPVSPEALFPRQR